MKQALAEAEKAFEKGEVPIGAVIVHRERVIARSHNLTQTLSDPTAHAEMQAITAATSANGNKYLKDCTLYVTVEPCPMCAGASFWAQIGTIVYGTKDPKRGFSGCCPGILHPKTNIVEGIMENECAALMHRFFKELRK